VSTLDALAAGVAGDSDTRAAKLAESAGLVAQAEVIRTVPGETRPEGPVLVGDGVLDDFLAAASALR